MRSKWTLGSLLLVTVVVLAIAAPTQAAKSRRTVVFYAYTFGDGVPVRNSSCSCVVWPCPPIYEAVGGYTVECDGTRTDEWGYVDWNGQCAMQNHPTDRKIESIEPCPLAP
jgi:hypothetical protein